MRAAADRLVLFVLSDQNKASAAGYPLDTARNFNGRSSTLTVVSTSISEGRLTGAIASVYSSIVERYAARILPPTVFHNTNNENGVKTNESQYDRLLHLVYDTLDNPCAWKDFCALLREATGVASIHLYAFDRQRDLFSWSDGFALAGAEPLERIRPLYRDDTRLAWLRAYPPGKWLHCGAEPDCAAGFELCPFEEGHRCAALCKLIEQNGLAVMLACRTHAEDGPLPGEHRALLERLTPHLVRAVRLYLRRFALNADTLANRSRPPAMLVSALGEVLHSNEAAQRLLKATSLVRVRGRRITLAAPHHARLLEDIAVSEVRLRNRMSGARAAAARFRALRIVGAADGTPALRAPDAAAATDPHGRTLGGRARAQAPASQQEVLYAFYNVVTADDASASELHAFAALTFYHPRSAPLVDERVLATAFDLSPAECRIALLLAEGLTQKEIAAHVGVQHDTVRKQLQSIFQKTATRRQPDLLRLLLNLPARGTGAAAEG
ncbi:DNA-binding CsgD family transcriptional regulator [Paraburkholderia silvatlantica]|nr:DNA-binding CsgD family transcriptional regulator [Paraburkholderia silvatlantica]PXW32152.1 DNA-binding CsgD family transcriptional regulator [Paraburkholderia silvatlantica]